MGYYVDLFNLKTAINIMILEPAQSNITGKNLPKAVSKSTVLTVTKITKQTKNTDRYSIYINEKYSFSLSEYQLASARLFIGKEFTPAELEEFINESQFGKAYERALNYVMIRPRSQKEIQDYLKRTFLYPKPKSYIDKVGQRHFKKVEVDTAKVTTMIERVMERLNDRGYINDEAFAKAWISSRQLNKHSSKRKLEQELRAKGINSETIATELQKQNVTDTETLQALIIKKRRLPRYKDDNTKLMQYLLRQGYNYDDITSSLTKDE